jgi:hypothetical protein
MVPTMSQPGGRRQGPACACFETNFGCQTPAPGAWLIIIKALGLPDKGRSPPSPGAPMRPLSAFIACAFLLVASAASADSRVFIIANQADGYGVDQCLARGEKCGAHAARSYCQSRDFAQATAFRRVDPDEITGAVPGNEKCTGNSCGEYVAITCQR